MIRVQDVKAVKEEGTRKVPRFTKKEEDRLVRQLLTERDRLARQINLMHQEYSVNVRESSGDLSSTPSHIADVGTDMMEREYAFFVASNLRRRMTLIDEALQKLYKRKGFGDCLMCGRSIEKKRLKALPYAVLCFECMKTHES